MLDEDAGTGDADVRELAQDHFRQRQNHQQRQDKHDQRIFARNQQPKP